MSIGLAHAPEWAVFGFVMALAVGCIYAGWLATRDERDGRR